MESRRIGHATPYNIVIKPSDNMGFVIRIGCNAKTLEGPGALLVARSKEDLVDLLHTYLEDPKGCEEEYSKMYKEPPADIEATESERPAGEADGAER